MESLVQFKFTTLILIHTPSFNFALAFFVAPAFTNIVWKTYIFFTYPKTAGRTLEEIDAVFDADVPAWRSGKLHENAFQEKMRAVQEVKGMADEPRASQVDTV